MSVPNFNDSQNIGEHDVAEQRIEEFLDLASHELRTPLTTIKGNLTLAKRFLLNCLREVPTDQERLKSRLQEIQTMLERADQQADIQNRLLSDLQDATRLTSRRMKLMFTLCDLSSITQRVVEEQRSMAAARTIRLDMPSATPISITADAYHIGHTISNYISNALKFSSHESCVVVRVQLLGDYARLAVEDAGPGIPPDEQPRVWERFYRVPGIERRSGASVGLGLGLYLCRTIIKEHHGQVGLESTPGKGSTFWFTLPLAAQQLSVSRA